eukprot:sb/3477244/
MSLNNQMTTEEDRPPLPGGVEEDKEELLTEVRFKQPIRTRYLGHVTGYQPIRDQYFLIRSIPDTLLSLPMTRVAQQLGRIAVKARRGNQKPTESSKQPIRTRYLGHVTG